MANDVPESVRQELESFSDRQLRAIIRSAQELLRDRNSPTQRIEPRHNGEEIVSIDDKGDHTLVIVKEEGSPEKHAYHVSVSPQIDSDEPKYNWRYIGPTAE